MEWFDNIYNSIIDWLEDYGLLALLIIVAVVCAISVYRSDAARRKAGWREYLYRPSSDPSDPYRSVWLPPTTIDIDNVVNRLEKNIEELEQLKAKYEKELAEIEAQKNSTNSNPQ